MMDAFTEMTKDGFGLADLSNGPVVEADYRSFGCMRLRYMFVDLAPEFQRCLLITVIHWCRERRSQSTVRGVVLTGPPTFSEAIPEQPHHKPRFLRKIS
jgi:hypothetical protein